MDLSVIWANLAKGSLAAGIAEVDIVLLQGTADTTDTITFSFPHLVGYEELIEDHADILLRIAEVNVSRDIFVYKSE